MAEDKGNIIVAEKENMTASIEQIQNLIYVIRGKQVMLDSDLAMLYQVETKVFNQAVKRNLERFPENFRFQLTSEEYETLRSQFVTSNKGKGGRRYLPFVFTEQGIAMLSAVLRSDVAIRVSIRIMETFVEMRKYMANTSILYDRMNVMEERQLTYQNETNEKFEKVFAYISEHEESKQKVFFDGQIYDAFSVLVELVKSAEKNIVLVDNYVDTGTLNILSKKNVGVDVTIYTVEKTKLSQKDVKVFNQQYPNLKLQYTGIFHDRFLIVDREKTYHIGASLKDAGKKCFAVSLLNDKAVVNDILQRLGVEIKDHNVL